MRRDFSVSRRRATEPTATRPRAAGLADRHLGHRPGPRDPSARRGPPRPSSQSGGRARCRRLAGTSPQPSSGLWACRRVSDLDGRPSSPCGGVTSAATFHRAARPQRTALSMTPRSMSRCARRRRSSCLPAWRHGQSDENADCCTSGGSSNRRAGMPGGEGAQQAVRHRKRHCQGHDRGHVGRNRQLAVGLCLPGANNRTCRRPCNGPDPRAGPAGVMVALAGVAARGQPRYAVPAFVLGGGAGDDGAGR